MSKCKPCSTPIAISPTLSKCDGQPLLQGDDYQKLLGALQYVTITCPNIAFSVNKLCQFMHAPTNIHWKTLKCLLHYLNGTNRLVYIFQLSHLLPCIVIWIVIGVVILMINVLQMDMQFFSAHL